MLKRLRRRWPVIPTWVKVAPVAGLLIALAAFHRQALQTGHAMLPVIEQFFFLPLFMSSLLFGLRGGLFCALLISASFFPMLFTELMSQGMAVLGAGLQVGLYFLTGSITGLLVDREEREARRTKQAEHLALLGQAAAVVAHELKSPLVAIGGFSQRMLKETPPTHPNHDKLRIIVEQVEHMELLLREMLDYSRPLDLSLSRQPFNQLVADSLALVSMQAEEAGVSLVSSLAAELDSALLDGGRIRQVVLNLVQNAVQASKDGGKVWVSTRQEAGQAVLLVRDQGPGIAPEDQEKVFFPFYTTKRRGTGLGLAVTRKIVQAHGGFMELSSQPDSGSTFTVYLPLDGPHQD